MLPALCPGDLVACGLLCSVLCGACLVPVAPIHSCWHFLTFLSSVIDPFVDPFLPSDPTTTTTAAAPPRPALTQRQSFTFTNTHHLQVTHSGAARSLAKEVGMASVSSLLLGGGALFLILFFDVYV